MSDLDFISGNFFDVDLPREWKYLEKYFHSDVQRAFLYYYYTFDNTELMADHTGHPVSKRWLRKLKSKLRNIRNAHKKAKSEFDIEMVAIIESGKFRGFYKTDGT